MIPIATLPGTPRSTTVLGFGCNSLLGPKPRREALAILAAAYDEGIRHFDVARAYSSGDAEGVVGEFLAGRRHEVTLTTKFGLLPSGPASRLRWLKPVARRIMRLSPRMRRMVGAQSSRMVLSGAYSPQRVRGTLEMSLRELRTDHITVYLAHEADAPDCTDELADFLEEQVAKGTIAAYGVGSNFERVEKVVQERPRFTRIVQFESSVLNRNRAAYRAPRTETVITHGAISGTAKMLQARLAADAALARAWSDELGLDVSTPDNLAALMLAHAIRANPGGIVLFSSTRIQAIRHNIRAIAENRFSSQQLDRFESLTNRL